MAPAVLCLFLLLLLLRRQSVTSATLQRKLSRLLEAEARHDYHRKIQLEQLDAYIQRVRSVVEGVDGRLRPADTELQLPYTKEPNLPRVLFVTSNGAGMGHLTRCLAVARSGIGTFQSQFVSLSSAAEIVRRFGFGVLKYPSYGQSQGVSQAEWNNRFSEFFDAVCHANKPDAIVYDGTWIYRGVHESARRHRAKLIWLRRGLWMPTSSTLQLHDAASIVDHVLVPRDIADQADTGPAAKAEGTIVPAPTLTTFLEVLPRQKALLALGLNADKTYVLVQLGGGTVNDIVGLRDRVINQILESSPTIEVVVALSPLSQTFSDNRERVHVIREYPVARMLQGFAFMVTAAGYNSVHESVRFGTPAVVIPNSNTATDNQRLRAAEYARLGYGLAAITDGEVHSAIAQLLRPHNLEKFRRRILASDLPIDSGEGAAELVGAWLASPVLRNT